jgi:hypothetical protein
MKTNITQEKALRWTAQGLTVLVVLAVAAAVMLYFKIGELEASVSQARAETDKENQAAAATRNKLQAELKAAGAKLAALEQQQNDANKLKTLLAKAEPQIAAALEAAARTGKPDARAAALAGLGLIGQIARGSNNAEALAILDRALLVDKANCVAGLAVNLGGARKIEVAPECQAMLPGAPGASEARPAAEAKPEAAPAGGAAKAAPPAAKG